MPLITEREHVKDVYQEATELGLALPVFCAEDRETLEAILAAGLEVGREIGVDDMPVIPAWTSRYPPRGQMTLITACGDPVLGTRLMFSDLEAFTDEGSPYRRLRVMPHLDHGIPWLDEDTLHGFADRFASVMCDASEKPFEENMRLTAEYVEKQGGRVIVEGAVDEIFESGGTGQKNEPTTVEQARRFLSQTGVDMIVPNVGTEHRATADVIVYRRDHARQLRDAVGRIMCLHGTSSVKPEDLPGLPDDGFIKVNIYTTLAVRGGQALARHVLENLPRIFTDPELGELAEHGLLGEAVLRAAQGHKGPARKPVLSYVANPLRRQAWFTAVRDRCKDFMWTLGCEKYAG
jgi:fructose-bisphosphate aldolase class II